MTIHELFESVDADNEDNPFDTEKEAKLLNSVTDLLSALDKNGKFIDDYASKVYDLIMYERERAFTVGYQTAVSLIFAGVTAE